MLKIQIGGSEIDASVELKIRQALDGTLLVMDHPKIDIAIMPKKLKVVTFPKKTVSEDVYEYQDRLLELMADKGILDRNSIQGGNVYRSLEGSLLTSDQGINPIQVALYVVSEYVKTEQEHERIAAEYEKELEDHYTHPDDRNSTEYGEVPQYAEKGSMRPGYYYHPLRNRI